MAGSGSTSAAGELVPQARFTSMLGDAVAELMPAETNSAVPAGSVRAALPPSRQVRKPVLPPQARLQAGWERLRVARAAVMPQVPVATAVVEERAPEPRVATPAVVSMWEPVDAPQTENALPVEPKVEAVGGVVRPPAEAVASPHVVEVPRVAVRKQVVEKAVASLQVAKVPRVAVQDAAVEKVVASPTVVEPQSAAVPEPVAKVVASPPRVVAAQPVAVREPAEKVVALPRGVVRQPAVEKAVASPPVVETQSAAVREPVEKAVTSPRLAEARLAAVQKPVENAVASPQVVETPSAVEQPVENVVEAPVAVAAPRPLPAVKDVQKQVPIEQFVPSFFPVPSPRPVLRGRVESSPAKPDRVRNRPPGARAEEAAVPAPIESATPLQNTAPETSDKPTPKNDTDAPVRPRAAAVEVGPEKVMASGGAPVDPKPQLAFEGRLLRVAPVSDDAEIAPPAIATVVPVHASKEIRPEPATVAPPTAEVAPKTVTSPKRNAPATPAAAAASPDKTAANVEVAPPESSRVVPVTAAWVAPARLQGEAQETVAPRQTEIVEAAPPEVPKTATAAREIKLELNGGDQKVEVRLVDRGGDVHVAVRTADTHLAGALREDLPALSARLEQGGFRAENWHTGVAGPQDRQRTVETPAQGFTQDQQSRSGQERGQREGREHPPRQPQNPQTKDDRKDFAWLFTSLR